MYYLVTQKSRIKKNWRIETILGLIGGIILALILIFVDTLIELKSAHQDELYIYEIAKNTDRTDVIDKHYWQNLKIQCNAEDINLKTDKLKFTYNIKNLGDKNILIGFGRPLGKISIRPRLMTLDGRVVLDSIPYKIDDIKLIRSRGAYKAAVEFDSKILSEMMEQVRLEGKYILNFDFVQEGYAWWNVGICAIEVTR